MQVRQQSLMQQEFGHRKTGDADNGSCSTDTSRWSSPPRLCCGSDSPQYSSDCEDKVDSLIHRTTDAFSSSKWHPGRKTGKKVEGLYKQKTNYAVNHQILKLPPVKTPQASKPRSQSSNLNCIRELKSQVWDLQQQLGEVSTENKLLKRIQHRHMVALQHFQDSEGSISQILTKHNNEARVLQELLRGSRACRDNLARQLQAAENKLLNTKATLQHLQLLSQDHSLLEREELTLRLAKATGELEEKDKRMLDMEKNLELCQASFRRQMVTEHRKINEARKITSYLQEQVYQLNNKVQDKERNLQKYNIYSHRFLKGSSKKGRENKMVQTDGSVLLCADAASVLETEYYETEEQQEQQESSMNWCCYDPGQKGLVLRNPMGDVSALEENHQEDIETCADMNEEDRCSEQSPEYQNKGDCAKEKETSEASQVLEEKQGPEHNSRVAHILEKSLNGTEPKRKDHKVSKVRHTYTCKQSTEILHGGRPAYSSTNTGRRESTSNTVNVKMLSRGVDVLHLADGEPRRGGVDGSQ